MLLSPPSKSRTYTGPRTLGFPPPCREGLVVVGKTLVDVPHLKQVINGRAGDLLSYAIGRELFGDIRFDACGSVDISFSGFRIAAAQFGNPTGIQSGGMFRVGPKRRVGVCNGFSYRTNL